MKETTKRGVLSSVPLTIYYSGDQDESNKMGGTMARLATDVHTGFWMGDLRVGDNLEDLSVDGRILFKCIFEKWDEEPVL